jgi:hypothetical protein
VSTTFEHAKASAQVLPVRAVAPQRVPIEIGRTDDPAEHEANRVAAQLVQPAGAVDLRRSPAALASGSAPPIVHDVLSAPGCPLDATTRGYFEPRLGTDLSDVRLHDDNRAAQSANAVGAHAYTVGNHIAFAAGSYTPGAPEKCKLLAHELVHVAQQRGSSPAPRSFLDVVLGRRAVSASDPSLVQGQTVAPQSVRTSRSYSPPTYAVSLVHGVLEDSAPASPSPGELERVLALQRTIGNRAVSTLLQRSEVTSGDAPVVRFRIGVDVKPPLSSDAWSLTRERALDDGGIAALREAALREDHTIDDNERMFIAALINEENAKTSHSEHPLGFLPGAIVQFAASSITAANRLRVQDFGQASTPWLSTGPSGWRQKIIDLAGPFAGTARDALTLADEASVSLIALYNAMLNGASDSTQGDRAFAGAVYVIAEREGLPVAAELIASRVKVDEVAPSHLPKNAAGMYQSEANAAGWKGDTLYLPSDLQFSSLGGQATVVHELTHVGQDAAVKSPTLIPVAESETEAFRAEARFFLDKIGRLTGLSRAQAVEEVAKDIRLPGLLSMVLEATWTLGAVAVVKEVHAKVLTDGDPKTAEKFSASDFSAMLQALEGSDEDLYQKAISELYGRIDKAIAHDYAAYGPARDRGFIGESILDRNAPATR